jgi:5S rRNA maturation endonuclease (ribonuclease M5)
VFPYCNEKGETVYEVVRFIPKNFVARHTCPTGKIVYNLGGDPKKCSCPKITPMLFGLPELLAADPRRTVYLPEGELKKQRLEDLGLVSTCFGFGAGKSDKVNNVSVLKDRPVVILTDNDDPGRAHGQKVAKQLYGVAASIKVLELPDLPEKGDIIDWLDAGGTVDELEALAAKCPLWEPPEEASEKKKGKRSGPC